MRVLVQRSLESSVLVDNKIVGKIESGLVLLVGFTYGDSKKEIDYMVDKVINLRIFDDENGVMNKSLMDVKGSILSISQFTLYGNAKKGRRPSYVDALGGEDASKLYDEFNNELLKHNIKVETGIFGADMVVNITNDGPVTLLLTKDGDKNE
ncbi:MAG: D-aminoacyl-tRNA deacylase [Bacilli bacterium]